MVNSMVARPRGRRTRRTHRHIGHPTQFTQR